MTTRSPGPSAPPAMDRRLVSWGWDYVVILGWLACMFVLVGVPTLMGWLDLESVWSRPIAADFMAAMFSVAPVLAYFTITEAGVRQASWGKRRAGLRVVRADSGARAGRWRILIRNVLKLTPWQLGHLSALRFATQSGSQEFAMVAFVASLLMLILVAGPPWVGGRGLHDRVAGTIVIIAAR